MPLIFYAFDKLIIHLNYFTKPNYDLKHPTVIYACDE